MASKAPTADDVPAGLLDMPAPWLRSLIRHHLGSETDVKQQEQQGHQQEQQGKPRLQLFMSSMGLASVVLQHTHEIRLCLACPKGHNNLKQGSRTSSSRGMASGLGLGLGLGQRYRQQKFEKRVSALQTLLSKVGKAELHVELQGTAISLWTELPKQHITHLYLSDMTLNRGMLLNQLQLQQCTKLQALTIDPFCGIEFSDTDVIVLSQTRAEWLPPSLTHLTVFPDGNPDQRPIARLLGPQITHLESVPMRGDSSVDLQSAIPYFTSLTHFNTGVLGGGLLEELLALPDLIHVSASGCHIYKNYSFKQCRWQVLEFRDGADLPSLARLPLRSIQHVSVGHHLKCEQDYDEVDDRVWDKLFSLGNLQLIPSTRVVPPWGVPGFNLTGSHLGEQLLFCAVHLAAPTPTPTPHPHPHAQPDAHTNPTTTPAPSTSSRAHPNPQCHAHASPTSTAIPTPTHSTSSHINPTHESSKSGFVITVHDFEHEVQDVSVTVRYLPPSVTTLCFTTQRSQLWVAQEVQAAMGYGVQDNMTLDLDDWPAVMAALPPHLKQVAVKCADSQKVAAAHAKAMLQGLSNSQEHAETSVGVVLWDEEELEEQVQALVETYPQFKVIREEDLQGELRLKQDLRRRAVPRRLV